MGGGGHLQKGVPRFLHMSLQLLQLLRLLQKVGLVAHHDLRALGKLGRIIFQFFIDGVKIRHRVAPLAAGHIHQMHQQAAAVDMPQEIMSQTRTLTGTLDDAGDIRHDEADTVVHIHNAQIGIEGGEVVVGDLGVRLADNTQERGLAHVGKAHKTHIRQQLQLQNHIVTLAGKAGLGKAGHLTGGRGKMLIAPAASAALTEDERLLVGHILDDLAGFGVPDQGAPRHADGEALTVLAAFAAALPVYAASGHIFALIAEVHKGGHIVVHLHDDAAAVAAVAAVGAAGRDIFFSVKGHRAVAAVAGSDAYARLINESVCHTIIPRCLISYILPKNGLSVKLTPP